MSKQIETMNYLNALLDALIGFVKRNPILVLVIVLPRLKKRRAKRKQKKDEE